MSVLECATEIDLLAVIFHYVYVNLRLLNIACQARSDNFTKLFQRLASNIHVANKGIEQRTVISYYTCVSSIGLLSTSGNSQLRMIPYGNKQRVVGANPIIFRGVVKQRLRDAEPVHHSLILRNQLGSDLNQLHHAVFR